MLLYMYIIILLYMYIIILLYMYTGDVPVYVTYLCNIYIYICNIVVITCCLDMLISHDNSLSLKSVIPIVDQTIIVIKNISFLST
jgi:hypothetical protein